MENVITLGKLIGLLFCHPSSLENSKNTRNDLAHPVMGYHFSSTVSLIYVSVLSVVCQINCVGGITWPTRMLKVIFGR